MAGPIIRILGQVAVMAAGIFGKAFVTAYQQAVQQAKAGGGAKQAASAAAKAAGIEKNVLTKSEARQILNLEKSDCTPENIQKQYDRYFNANAVDNGGSFYLQSKVYRAKELLDFHMMEKEREAREKKLQEEKK
mmetsp:Transcript_28275/g.53518  ORF Transcript_28275/g.53518 Transcript_28275/m.53518 type:complete len:134 (-) Transcript_28275:107-508(-)|eukprot:CAMPEP_0182507276 /NCGR_PEP_ID=MMETSP1321-20130603/22799_1 /TAXON_ID=91990 /ORGANISM="Bolidomonas sp., Strain RCC1657" /LENGTH=133 /DNA_ID=CAMNT_0024713145 /DNA_START=428 /DNA_END=829 /DNA_ORIENTATION=+